MTEAEWRRIVVILARKNGWLVSYIPDSRRVVGSRGVPDLTLARNGVVLLVELKTDKGRISKGQELWAHHIGESYRLWRPSDMERVRNELMVE